MCLYVFFPHRMLLLIAFFATFFVPFFVPVCQLIPQTQNKIHILLKIRFSYSYSTLKDTEKREKKKKQTHLAYLRGTLYRIAVDMTTYLFGNELKRLVTCFCDTSNQHKH